MKGIFPLLLFALLGFAVGGPLLLVRTNAISRTKAAKSWDVVPCTIETAGWKSGDENERYFDITYTYEVDGKSHKSSQLDLMIGVSGDPLPWYRRLEKKFPAGSPATCYVNPLDPSDAVLDRDHAIEGLRGLGILATIFLSIGVVFVAIIMSPHVSSLTERIVAAVVKPNSASDSQIGAHAAADSNERRFSFFGAIVYALGEPKGNMAAWAFFLPFAFVAGIIMDGRGMILDLLPVHDRRNATATVLHADRKTGHEFGSPNFEFTFRYEVDGKEYEASSMAAGKKFEAGDLATAEYQVLAPAEARLLGARQREVPAWVICFFGSVPALLGVTLFLIPFQTLKYAWQARNSEELSQKLHIPDYVYRRDPVGFAHACPHALVPIIGWAILIAMLRFY